MLTRLTSNRDLRPLVDETLCEYIDRVLCGFQRRHLYEFIRSQTFFEPSYVFSLMRYAFVLKSTTSSVVW